MEEIQTPTVLVEPSESPSLLQKLGKMISKRFGHSQKNAKENNELKSMVSFFILLALYTDYT